MCKKFIDFEFVVWQCFVGLVQWWGKILFEIIVQLIEDVEYKEKYVSKMLSLKYDLQVLLGKEQSGRIVDLFVGGCSGWGLFYSFQLLKWVRGYKKNLLKWVFLLVII